MTTLLTSSNLSSNKVFRLSAICSSCYIFTFIYCCCVVRSTHIIISFVTFCMAALRYAVVIYVHWMCKMAKRRCYLYQQREQKVSAAKVSHVLYIEFKLRYQSVTTTNTERGKYVKHRMRVLNRLSTTQGTVQYTYCWQFSLITFLFCVPWMWLWSTAHSQSNFVPGFYFIFGYSCCLMRWHSSHM